MLLLLDDEQHADLLLLLLMSPDDRRSRPGWPWPGRPRPGGIIDRNSRDILGVVASGIDCEDDR
jgi:hypothetical protein